jgi:hypothetical protein
MRTLFFGCPQQKAGSSRLKAVRNDNRVMTTAGEATGRAARTTPEIVETPSRDGCSAPFLGL